MSKENRDQRRAEARAQREAAEAAATQAEQRRKRLTILGGIVVAAVVVVVAVVLIAGNHSSSDKTAASGGTSTVANAATIQEQLGGVPQKGDTLGKSDAPVSIIEYGDLQCPICANFSNTIMPGVVSDYISQGKARIQFRNFAFIGDDSNKLAQAALAAGLQNKQFDFNELVYANQGEENSGYATDAYIKKIFQSIPGLNVQKAIKDMNGKAVADKFTQDMQLAQAAGISATPTIFVGRSGQTPQVVNYPDLPSKLAALTA